MLWLYHSNETLPNRTFVRYDLFRGLLGDFWWPSSLPTIGTEKFKFDVLDVKVFIMKVRYRFRAGRCYGKVEVKCDIDFLAQSRTLKILLNHINRYQDQNMLIKQLITKRSLTVCTSLDRFQTPVIVRMWLGQLGLNLVEAGACLRAK